MNQISGKHMLRALSYALKAAPAGDATARLAHLVIHRHLGDHAGIVGADGERFHVGYLPREALPPRPVAVTRESCATLRLSLEYAQRMSKLRSMQFSVSLVEAATSDGLPTGKLVQLDVVIDYGARHPIVHPLMSCDVGYIPEHWDEPAAPSDDDDDAPLELRAQHLKEAQEWYRAWDVDHGTTQLRWRGGKIARLDITAGGDLVASAHILAPSMPPAQLVHDEPLFESLHGRKVGQSILDLQLDGDGAPPSKPDDEEDLPKRKRGRPKKEAAPAAENAASDEVGA